MTPKMKCALCSFEFDEKLTQRSCLGCFKLGSCSMVKCPGCGYEVPPEPRWLRKINHFFKREA